QNNIILIYLFFFFSSRRRHTRSYGDWSSDVCSSDLTPQEICTDSFQADRSPTGMYRTTPLRGLWAHAKGGFYHDGRFPTLGAVRSEERRVGKECRSRWAREQLKEK